MKCGISIKKNRLKYAKDYDITASDCFYLATSRDKYYTRQKTYEWNDTARICITPVI